MTLPIKIITSVLKVLTLIVTIIITSIAASPTVVTAILVIMFAHLKITLVTPDITE
jgi:hypothetical protein